MYVTIFFTKIINIFNYLSIFSHTIFIIAITIFPDNYAQQTISLKRLGQKYGTAEVVYWYNIIKNVSHKKPQLEKINNVYFQKYYEKTYNLLDKLTIPLTVRFIHQLAWHFVTIKKIRFYFAQEIIESYILPHFDQERWLLYLTSFEPHIFISPKIISEKNILRPFIYKNKLICTNNMSSMARANYNKSVMYIFNNRVKIEKKKYIYTISVPIDDNKIKLACFKRNYLALVDWNNRIMWFNMVKNLVFGKQKVYLDGIIKSICFEHNNDICFVVDEDKNTAIKRIDIKDNNVHHLGTHKCGTINEIMIHKNKIVISNVLDHSITCYNYQTDNIQYKSPLWKTHFKHCQKNITYWRNNTFTSWDAYTGSVKFLDMVTGNQLYYLNIPCVANTSNSIIHFHARDNMMALQDSAKSTIFKPSFSYTQSTKNNNKESFTNNLEYMTLLSHLKNEYHRIMWSKSHNQ